MTTLKKHYLLALLYSFLSLTPLLIYIICIQQNAVNIPVMDEWQLVNFRLQAISSSISWKDIFALHNEHRIASLRLIALATNQFSTGWQASLRMAISCVIATATFLLLLLLAWRQFKASVGDNISSRDSHVFGLASVATSLLFFCPSQHENWLWGFQIPWFLIQLILISTILLLYEFLKSQQLIYYLAAVLMCFVASFSLAHGLFVWLACLPMFLTKGLKRNTQFTFAGLWIGATVIAFVAYMAGYSKPVGHPSTSLLLERPGAAVDFFLNLLGNALGQDGVSSFVLGLIILFTFLSLVILCYKESAKTWNDALAWISIGLFPIIFAATTTVGRLGLGSGAALASRYSTVTLLLPICLVQLFRIFLDHKKRLDKLIRPLIVSSLLFGFILTSIIDGYQNGLADARSAMHNRQQGKACLELYEQMEPEFANECITSFIYPLPSFPLEIMKGLSDAGVIAPSSTPLSDNKR